MHYVQTRIATIDTYSVFFILLMYLFMYLWLTEDKLWALALCGVSFGLGAAAKWTSIYAGAGLALLWAAHWSAAPCLAPQALGRRRTGRRGDRSKIRFLPAFLKNVGLLPGVLHRRPGADLLLSAICPTARRRAQRPFFSGTIPRIVLDNQRFMFTYHAGIVARRTPIPPAGISGCWTSGPSCTIWSISPTGAGSASPPS